MPGLCPGNHMVSKAINRTQVSGLLTPPPPQLPAPVLQFPCGGAGKGHSSLQPPSLPQSSLRLPAPPPHHPSFMRCARGCVTGLAGGGPDHKCSRSVPWCLQEHPLPADVTAGEKPRLRRGHWAGSMHGGGCVHPAHLCMCITYVLCARAWHTCEAHVCMHHACAVCMCVLHVPAEWAWSMCKHVPCMCPLAMHIQCMYVPDLASPKPCPPAPIAGQACPSVVFGGG